MNQNKYLKQHEDINNRNRFIQAFRNEFELMKQLEKTIGLETYRQYFPKYYGAGIYNNKPSILMEYINGISLRDFLQKKVDSHSFHCSEPYFYFTRSELSHLMQQIYTMLSLLYENNIYYFDLNLNNIIVTKEDPITLKLVDFTFVGDIQIDNRMLSTLPANLKIINATMLFFTRLFYAPDNYDQSFALYSSQKSSDFFTSHFPKSFNQLFMPTANLEALQKYADNTLDLFQKWYMLLQSNLI